MLPSEELVGDLRAGGVLALWGRARVKPCAALSPPTARYAEEACALLTSSKFEACHRAVGPLPYVQNCRYDVCSCSDGRDCLCSAVASYAAACARRGVHIGWREPGFCGGCPPCPPVPAQPSRALLGCPAHGLSFSKHCLCITAFRTRPKRIWQAWVVKTLRLQPLSTSISSKTRWWGLVLPQDSVITVACSRSASCIPPTSRSRTWESLPSRNFLWLLPPSVQYMYGQVEE